MYRKLDDQWEAPSRQWRKELANLQADGERSLEQQTQNWASLDWDAEDPSLPDLTIPEDADVFVIDQRLWAARAFLQEVMIKTHHSMHLGHREIQFPRDQRHRIVGHEAQLILDCVQNRHQRTRDRLQSRTDAENRVLLNARHESDRTYSYCLPIGHEKSCPFI